MLGMSEHYAASGNLEGSAIKETQKAFLGTKRKNTCLPIHVLGLALAGNPRSLRYLQSHFYACWLVFFGSLGNLGKILERVSHLIALGFEIFFVMRIRRHT